VSTQEGRATVPDQDSEAALRRHQARREREVDAFIGEVQAYVQERLRSYTPGVSLSTEALIAHRSRFQKIARDYWEEQTAATSLARSHAWTAAREAGVPAQVVREWDTQVAEELSPGFKAM
jgi:hypothetical protein